MKHFSATGSGNLPIGLPVILGLLALGTALFCTACDNGTDPDTPTTSLVAMASINGGTFQMGQEEVSGATPVHSVTVSAFKMGKYEVTQEEYQAVMGSNPSKFNGSSGKEAADGEVQEKRHVEMVSWYDALVFCNRLSMREGLTPAYTINGSTDPDQWGAVPESDDDDAYAVWNEVTWNSAANGYRLPTEAEWEYACRAGTTAAYHTGETITEDTGWYTGNSEGKTHEVGKKPANAWGLYDMHGNVLEWCWDRYGDYTSGTQTNPSGAGSGSGRVFRGGAWANSANGLRSANRYADSPDVRYSDLGFRLARSE